jgi:hypothetical protein
MHGLIKKPLAIGSEKYEIRQSGSLRLDCTKNLRLLAKSDHSQESEGHTYFNHGRNIVQTWQAYAIIHTRKKNKGQTETGAVQRHEIWKPVWWISSIKRNINWLHMALPYPTSVHMKKLGALIVEGGRTTPQGGTRFRLD